MLAINSVFDFEPETAGYHLWSQSSDDSKGGVAVFCLFSDFRNGKISAHIVQQSLFKCPRCVVYKPSSLSI